MTNAAAWYTELRTIELNRAIRHLLTNPAHPEDALSLTNSNNLRLVLRKIIHADLWPQCAGENVAAICATVRELEPDVDLARRKISRRARDLVCGSYLTKYVLSHLAANSRLMYLDPNQIDPDSSASCHLHRLLDVLSCLVRQANIHMVNRCEASSSVTRAEIHQVGRALVANDGGRPKSIFAGAAIP